MLDVAPTVLRLFGLATAADMDGRALDAALAGTDAAEVIDSWDEVPGDAGMHPASLTSQPTDSVHSIRHLLDMGYVETPSRRAEKIAADARDRADFNRAVALFGTGRYEQASQLLEPLWQAAPGDVRRGYCLALCHLLRGQHEACQTVVDRILERLESARERRIERVAIFRRRLAEIGLQRVAEAASGTHPRGLDDVDAVAAGVRSLDERMAGIEERLKQHDLTAVPRLQLIRSVLALAESRTGEAAALVESAERVSNDSPVLLGQIGHVYLRLRRWEPARRVFGRILELDPHNAPAHNGAGAALLRLGHTTSAMEHVFTAAELLPNNPYTHYLAGVGFSRLGYPERAEEALLAAINLAPGFLLARRVLLGVYQHQLDRADLAAQQHFEIAAIRDRRRRSIEQSNVA